MHPSRQALAHQQKRVRGRAANSDSYSFFVSFRQLCVNRELWYAMMQGRGAATQQ